MCVGFEELTLRRSVEVEREREREKALMNTEEGSPTNGGDPPFSKRCTSLIVPYRQSVISSAMGNVIAVCNPPGGAVVLALCCLVQGRGFDFRPR